MALTRVIIFACLIGLLTLQISAQAQPDERQTMQDAKEAPQRPADPSDPQPVEPVLPVESAQPVETDQPAQPQETIRAEEYHAQQKEKRTGWGSRAAQKKKKSSYWNGEDKADAEYADYDEVAAEDDKTIMSEWEEHMSDFVPEDMITFEIAARTTFEFNQDIDTVPTKIRGAYFVSHTADSEINFKIIGPNKKKYFKKKNKKEGIFFFEADQLGQYTFQFNNDKWMESKQLTFAFHCGNSTDEQLQEEHLTPIEQALSKVDRQIKDVIIETKFSAKRQESHYHSVRTTQNRLLFFSFIETCGILGTTFWQIYYIKGLLAGNRIV